MYKLFGSTASSDKGFHRSHDLFSSFLCHMPLCRFLAKTSLLQAEAFYSELHTILPEDRHPQSFYAMAKASFWEQFACQRISSCHLTFSCDYWTSAEFAFPKRSCSVPSSSLCFGGGWGGGDVVSRVVTVWWWDRHEWFSLGSSRGRSPVCAVAVGPWAVACARATCQCNITAKMVFLSALCVEFKTVRSKSSLPISSISSLFLIEAH